MTGLAHRGSEVSFGTFGLQALEPAWVTSRQIEACRVAMTRHIKRGGKVWIRIFPDKPITKKPAETRMGKGKGSPEMWVAVVKPGRVMFEIEGVTRELAGDARVPEGRSREARREDQVCCPRGGGDRMKSEEIRALAENELVARIAELEEERFRLKFRSGTEALEEPLRLRSIRRDIARLKTVQRERQLATRGR